jgi:hypothetical protein
MLSLTQHGDFIYLSLYALAGLMSALSSFLMLLQHYGLQLQHLSPHSITLVAIFTHFCKMFVGVLSSMHLFRWFDMLCPVKRQSRPRWLLLPARDEGSIQVHCHP